MTRNKTLALVASVLCGLAFSAVAQNAPLSATDDTEPAATDRKEIADHSCLRQTGSRIIASANARADARKDPSKRQCASAPGRSYTRDDIDRTGAVDLADALRRLDPSIN
jgi:hypothetical protein